MTDQPDQKGNEDKVSIKGDGNVIGDHNAVTFIEERRIPFSIYQRGGISKHIPHQIPPPPRDYTGRDDEVQEILNYFDQSFNIVGIFGMGGIGKTALSFKLAEKLRDLYPDQIMVNLNGLGTRPISTREAMEYVVRSYFPDAADLYCHPDKARGQYLSLLDGRRTLILLDNAANGQQVQSLIPPKTCGLLITSRYKFALPGMKTRELEILEPDEAMNLLLKISDIRSSITEDETLKGSQNFVIIYLWL
jgi:hypothetical protein